MRRSVAFLALGTCTQAFVIPPRHRLLQLPTNVQRRQSSTVTTRPELHELGGRHCGRGRRGVCALTSISMRVGRPDGLDVSISIEGVDGETRRVRRTSRRPDLRSLRHLGQQVAAAAAVVAQPGVEVDIEGEQEDAEAETESGETHWEERDVVDRVVSGGIYDKHTKLYEPIEGVQIKKTYGFWTWQVFGFIFVQNFVRLLIRKGGDLKKLTMEEINWDHVVTEPEHLKELKAYCCEECGYTLYPARGRHEKFFDSVNDFKCPECDAPRSAFYDANDPDDPHNQAADEDLEEGTGDADDGDATIMAAAVSSLGGHKTGTVDSDAPESSDTSSDTFSEAPSPGHDEEEPFLKPAEESAASDLPSSTTDRDDQDDEVGDDLLDFE
ncbi:unnamed protein product [Ascophyllum nodosum]